MAGQPRSGQWKPQAGEAAAFLCLLALAAVSGPAHAAYRVGLTLSDPNPILGGQFGSEVEVMGANVLVGATAGTRPDAVHLFDGTTGALLRTFPDPLPRVPPQVHEFGAAIAAGNNRILVGAPSTANGEGRAYLFDATTGALLLTLTPPPAVFLFGTSVAFAGGNLVVGAPVASGDGKAFLFDGTSGALQTFTDPFGSNFGSNFGGSVSALGSDVLVGVSAPEGGPTCVSSLFESETGALIRSFAEGAALGFGTRVLTYGCLSEVRLYDGTMGALLRTFTDPNPADPGHGNSLFGFFAPAGAGANVLIPAPRAFNDEGAVYLFDAATGELLDTIRNPNPYIGCCDFLPDRFGSEVASLGANVVVGAPNEGGGPYQARGPGLVYVFVSSVGRANDAARLVLRRRKGKEKLVFVSKDPSFLFPAIGSTDDPGTGSPGGALLELASLAEPAGAALAVPPGLGKPGSQSKDANTDLHKYVNPDAPLGPSPVKSLTLKEGKGIKVIARAVGLALTEPQRAVGVRLTTGSLRNCVVFDAATIRHDEPDRFDAKAKIRSVPDCTELLPPTTTSTSTTTTTTSLTSTTTTTIVLAPCTGGTGYPTCNGVCPSGEQCQPTWDYRNDPVLGCSCYPAGVTPCIVSTYPACGGACSGGGVCQAFKLFGGLALCACVDPAGVCGTTVDGCNEGTCPSGQACTTFENACECTPQ